MATSLKLPPQLKARVAKVARSAGKTPHAFMVDAIARQTESAEQRRRFVESALEAESQAKRSGQAYDADEVHSAMEARARGAKTRRPRARPWRG